MPNIELVIDELVLHGFAPSDRGSIAVAVQRELVSLLGTIDPAQLRSADHIDGGHFKVHSPRLIGGQIANAIINRGGKK
jgi:hypothetical protein